uniref:OTU domain-containing protein n=1 Tax=Aegilops tauschii subsp. strangulata TaxID=200361 RepID=A0A453BWS8_AEGTS
MSSQRSETDDDKMIAMHVPRINTYFPTYSDATMDHHRLHDRLDAYGLFEVRVSGDGNCQLKACNSLYEGHVPMKYKHYCKKMKKSGEWGDHVTLQAAADKFAAKICLLTSFRDTCFVEIVPQYQAPQRELWLSFWSEIHY